MDFKTFADFYPYYLSEHQNLICRRLHFIGSCFVIAILALAILTANLMWLALVPIAGYGFAWVGHFFFEKNRPATFSHPLYSFIGDWLMFWDILRGRLSLS